jgi:thioredoxin-dependent peroxiredoxin
LIPTRFSPAVVVAVAAAMAFATRAGAQAPADTSGLGVGAMAPDFSLAGATRYGLLKAPVRLSDYRGETVVLAFFFKARTKG